MSVTEVLELLEGEGLIGTARGKIAMLNRAGMEAASCECYQDVRNEYDRLLGKNTTGYEAVSRR